MMKYKKMLQNKENIVTFDVLVNVHESKTVYISHHVLLSCIDHRQGSRYRFELHHITTHKTGIEKCKDPRKMFSDFHLIKISKALGSTSSILISLSLFSAKGPSSMALNTADLSTRGGILVEMLSVKGSRPTCEQNKCLISFTLHRY